MISLIFYLYIVFVEWAVFLLYYKFTVAYSIVQKICPVIIRWKASKAFNEALRNDDCMWISRRKTSWKILALFQNQSKDWFGYIVVPTRQRKWVRNFIVYPLLHYEKCRLAPKTFGFRHQGDHSGSPRKPQWNSRTPKLFSNSAREFPRMPKIEGIRR